MTTNSKLSTTEPKIIQKQNKLSKQVNRNRIKEMEITWSVISGEGMGGMGEKLQGIRGINGRYKIDRGRLKIVQEMEKPKNLYVGPIDMN